MYDVSSMLLGGTSQHVLQPKPRRIESSEDYVWKEWWLLHGLE
jgi:hypothetical protein